MCSLTNKHTRTRTFFGVAILSDAFMAGIEKITGTTKAVTTTNEQGESVTVEVSYLVCVAHTHTHTHTQTHTHAHLCVLIAVGVGV